MVVCVVQLAGICATVLWCIRARRKYLTIKAKEQRATDDLLNPAVRPHDSATAANDSKTLQTAAKKFAIPTSVWRILGLQILLLFSYGGLFAYHLVHPEVDITTFGSAFGVLIGTVVGSLLALTGFVLSLVKILDYFDRQTPAVQVVPNTLPHPGVGSAPITGVTIPPTSGFGSQSDQEPVVAQQMADSSSRDVSVSALVARAIRTGITGEEAQKVARMLRSLRGSKAQKDPAAAATSADAKGKAPAQVESSCDLAEEVSFVVSQFLEAKGKNKTGRGALRMAVRSKNKKTKRLRRDRESAFMIYDTDVFTVDGEFLGHIDKENLAHVRDIVAEFNGEAFYFVSEDDGHIVDFTEQGTDFYYGSVEHRTIQDDQGEAIGLDFDRVDFDYDQGEGENVTSRQYRTRRDRGQRTKFSELATRVLQSLSSQTESRNPGVAECLLEIAKLRQEFREKLTEVGEIVGTIQSSIESLTTVNAKQALEGLATDQPNALPVLPHPPVTVVTRCTPAAVVNHKCPVCGKAPHTGSCKANTVQQPLKPVVLSGPAPSKKESDQGNPGFTPRPECVVFIASRNGEDFHHIACGVIVNQRILTVSHVAEEVYEEARRGRRIYVFQLYNNDTGKVAEIVHPDLVSVPDSDFVWITNTCNGFKGIRQKDFSFVIDMDQPVGFGRPQVVYSSGQLAASFGLPKAPVVNWANTESSVQPSDERIDGVRSKVLTHAVDSGAGDCGLPVYQRNHVVGLHVAGSNNGRNSFVSLSVVAEKAFFLASAPVALRH